MADITAKNLPDFIDETAIFISRDCTGAASPAILDVILQAQLQLTTANGIGSDALLYNLV